MPLQGREILAVHFVDGEHGPEIAVVVDSDHVGRRVMRIDVTMEPVPGRHLEKQRVRDVEDHCIDPRAGARRAVRGGMGDGGGRNQGRDQDGEEGAPLEEPFGEGDAAESGSGGGEQQNPYKRDPPGAIEITLGADLGLQGSNIREQIARSSVHAEAPRVSTMRSNLPPRGTRENPS